jgi:hypothetical protein
MSRERALKSLTRTVPPHCRPTVTAHMSPPLPNLPAASLAAGWDEAFAASRQDVGDGLPVPGAPVSVPFHDVDCVVDDLDDTHPGRPASAASVEFVSSPAVQFIDESVASAPLAFARSPSVEFTGVGPAFGPQRGEQVPSQDWLYRPSDCGMTSRPAPSWLLADMYTDAQVDPPRFYRSQDEINAVHARYKHLLNPEHARRAKERDEAFVRAADECDAQRAERRAAVAAVPDCESSSFSLCCYSILTVATAKYLSSSTALSRSPSTVHLSSPPARRAQSPPRQNKSRSARVSRSHTRHRRGRLSCRWSFRQSSSLESTSSTPRPAHHSGYPIMAGMPPYRPSTHIPHTELGVQRWQG